LFVCCFGKFWDAESQGKNVFLVGKRETVSRYFPSFSRSEVKIKHKSFKIIIGGFFVVLLLSKARQTDKTEYLSNIFLEIFSKTWIAFLYRGKSS
jgi:hypothetical protein